MLAAVAGCASHASVSYRGVCENVRTHVRVADRRCAASPSASPVSSQHQMPVQGVFYCSGQTAPAIGSEGSGGTSSRPGEGAAVGGCAGAAEGGVGGGSSASRGGAGGG